MSSKKPFELEIREMTDDDRVTVAELSVHVDQAPWVPPITESLQLLDRTDEVQGVLFEVDGTVVGFCLVTDSQSETASIGGFLIGAQYQGNGYGSVAVGKVCAFIFEGHPKVNTILLTVREGNEAARRLYERAGFETTETYHHGERVFALDKSVWARRQGDR